MTKIIPTESHEPSNTRDANRDFEEQSGGIIAPVPPVNFFWGAPRLPQRRSPPHMMEVPSKVVSLDRRRRHRDTDDDSRT